MKNLLTKNLSEENIVIQVLVMTISKLENQHINKSIQMDSK